MTRKTPNRTTGPDVNEQATITDPATLIVAVLNLIDASEPRIPLDDEACRAIAEFRSAVITGEAPEHMALFIYDGLDNVRWNAINDPNAFRHGLSLIRFVHLCAVGMAGILPLGFEGVDDPEPIPFGRLLDMAFQVEPKLRKLLIVRNGETGGSLVRTTVRGRARFGASVRVELERLGALPDDEIFNLNMPYDAVA